MWAHLFILWLCCTSGGKKKKKHNDLQVMDWVSAYIISASTFKNLKHWQILMQVVQTRDPQGRLSQTFHVPRLINDVPLLTEPILNPNSVQCWETIIFQGSRWQPQPALKFSLLYIVICWRFYFFSPFPPFSLSPLLIPPFPILPLFPNDFLTDVTNYSTVGKTRSIFHSTKRESCVWVVMCFWGVMQTHV